MQPPGRRALAAKKRRRGREARAGAAAWTQATSRGGRRLRRLSEDVSGPLDPRFRGPHSFFHTSMRSWFLKGSRADSGWWL